jgi:hypothetical protein
MQYIGILVKVPDGIAIEPDNEKLRRLIAGKLDSVFSGVVDGITVDAMYEVVRPEDEEGSTPWPEDSQP